MNNHNFCPGYVFASCVPSADDERDSPSELDSFPTVAGYSAGISSRGWFSMELFVQLKVKKRFDPYQSNLLDKNDSLEGSSERLVSNTTAALQIRCVTDGLPVSALPFCCWDLWHHRSLLSI